MFDYYKTVFENLNPDCSNTYPQIQLSPPQKFETTIISERQQLTVE